LYYVNYTVHYITKKYLTNAWIVIYIICGFLLTFHFKGTSQIFHFCTVDINIQSVLAWFKWYNPKYDLFFSTNTKATTKIFRKYCSDLFMNL
jgi:hypothetical protein